jgi:prevent-host-death family protein
MTEMTIGIRDLKIHLSEYLRRVRQGQTILITDHGKAVGRILPMEQPLEERLESLRAAGLLAWNGETLPPLESPVVNQSGELVSGLVAAMREQGE